jgi:hypothetical protein
MNDDAVPIHLTLQTIATDASTPALTGGFVHVASGTLVFPSSVVSDAGCSEAAFSVWAGWY